MESVVIEGLFDSVYRGRRVLLTGHTGFKGSWLAFWLQALGAHVIGYSNGLPTKPNHFELLGLTIDSVEGDINDFETLSQVIDEYQPEIVFHLAAQSLVRYSYTHPLETFTTNVIGTVNVFEACRRSKTVRAIVNVTSDKAYENLGIDIAYKETDRIGGHDPYSASKGCAELVVSSYRNAYFQASTPSRQQSVLLASARAGNVIGGGDWAADRLIPDVIQASLTNIPASIRNPQATRPWQHVLEPLSGYLQLGQGLLQGKKEWADGWNFGPLRNETLPVEDVLLKMQQYWPRLNYQLHEQLNQLHEAQLLRLDCSKAVERLHWMPVWEMDEAIEKTVNWYKDFFEQNLVRTGNDLDEYIAAARQKALPWAIAQ